jgi:hypothetical protein
VYAVPTSYALGGTGDQNGQQYNHKIGRKAWNDFQSPVTGRNFRATICNALKFCNCEVQG